MTRLGKTDTKPLGTLTRLQRVAVLRCCGVAVLRRLFIFVGKSILMRFRCPIRLG